MRNFLIFSSLFLTFFVAQAKGIYTVSSVPNPMKVKHRYVSDPQHILQDATVDHINTELAALEKITGDQIAVVVLPSIGDEVPKDFAIDLFARFKIGQEYKDNGLLILLVIDQKRVEFETGYGLEGVLPDVVCKRIERDYMLPQFKAGQYDQGLLLGLTVVLKNLSSSEYRQQFSAEVEERKSISWVDFGRTLALSIAIPYFLFITIVFFVKRSRGSFAEIYPTMNRNKQKKVTLVIPTVMWLLLYVLIPLLFYGFMYYFRGPYYLLILFMGIYAMVLGSLVERKKRCVQAYKTSFVAGDYYSQYNNHFKYFDGWGIAAVFFPVPFLFTDWKNKQRLQVIRKHDRNCEQCNAPMVLLDEKSDDALLKENQLLEEQIKSVDYDVWLCKACHAHKALAYYTKDSKYSACSNCGTKAYYMKSDIVKVAATYEHAGEGEKSYQCMYCKKEQVDIYAIAQLTSSSTGGSSGSSSGGGSFGGGSSGGGGAGSSW